MATSVQFTGPYPSEWGKYLTEMEGALEEVPGTLYSVVDYTSAVTRELNFFNFVAGNRLDLTNMTDINKLSNPESFLAQYLQVFNWGNVQSDDSGAGLATTIPSQFNDWVEITKRGVVEMKIGRKEYGPWPMWKLPANSFVKGAFASGSDLLASYGQLDGAMYPLIPHLMFATMQPFYVKITWPAGPVTLSTGTTLPICVLFDGKAARAVQ